MPLQVLGLTCSLAEEGAHGDTWMGDGVMLEGAAPLYLFAAGTKAALHKQEQDSP